MVDNELITVRAVEDYFSKVTLHKNPVAPDTENEVENDSTEKTPDKTIEQVESEIAPGDPGADLKDRSALTKSAERPTSFPLSLHEVEEVVPRKAEVKGEYKVCNCFLTSAVLSVFALFNENKAQTCLYYTSRTNTCTCILFLGLINYQFTLFYSRYAENIIFK